MHNIIAHPQGESQTNPDDPRRFLEQFPPPSRSTIANWFHYAVHGGASTPPAVLIAVRATVQRRLQWRGDPAQDSLLHTILEALVTEDALGYAKSFIAYEQLPYEARRRVKAERAIHYVKEAMVGKCVTDKQAWRLRTLGYRGPEPVDRAQASALIDELMQERGQS